MTFFAILHCVKYVFKYIPSTRWSLQEIKKEKDVQDVECFHNVWEKKPNTLEISFKLKLSMFAEENHPSS